MRCNWPLNRTKRAKFERPHHLRLYAQPRCRVTGEVFRYSSDSSYSALTPSLTAICTLSHTAQHSFVSYVKNCINPRTLLLPLI